MPVKFLHKRYIVFKSECGLSPEDIAKTYKNLFGLIQLSLSNLSYIGSNDNIFVFSIGSKHISSLASAITYYAIYNNCRIILLGVCPTLKECRQKYVKL